MAFGVQGICRDAWNVPPYIYWTPSIVMTISYDSCNARCTQLKSSVEEWNVHHLHELLSQLHKAASIKTAHIRVDSKGLLVALARGPGVASGSEG